MNILLIATLFTKHILFGWAGCSSDTPSCILLTDSNIRTQQYKKFEVMLRDGSVHSVSLSRVKDLWFLIAKFMMGFITMRYRSPQPGNSNKEFQALDKELSGGYYVTQVLDFRRFVDVFSQTMPFPESKSFYRLETPVSALKFVRTFNQAKCEVNLQGLMLYIDDLYNACRVVNCVCRYVFGSVSMAMRPEYADLGSVLSDPYGPFKEMDDLRAKGDDANYVFGSVLDFKSNLKYLSNLQGLFVRYLENGPRLSLLAELCEKAKMIEKELSENEADYNKYLCNTEGFCTWLFRQLGIVGYGGRGRSLFIHSVRLRDICQNWSLRGLCNQCQYYESYGDPHMLLLMERVKENGGVLPPGLRKSRERFWDWRNKNVSTDIMVNIVKLWDRLTEKESDEFDEKHRDLFTDIYRVACRTYGSSWLNSTLYMVDTSCVCSLS
ncbi:hypothetical protein THOM_1512 [Trachipleistophora hominis]|uniref:Uncharacterized protein n=1 Tax=Trachipleistophora hominis TaxID=72359 RepID=L7JVT0_TRAHO|nr:hypothetical protein THOM_1512 [Trachipleistophora hominis]